MHVTRYTDYSLRVLMYLAAKNGELAIIREIAGSYGISKNHLMKIVQQLGAKGHLESVRGKYGGIRLHRDPSEINIGRLVRELEQEHELLECFGKENSCVITPACKLKSVFAEALESFYSTLDTYTLADLVPAGQDSRIRDLLHLETA